MGLNTKRVWPHFFKIIKESVQSDDVINRKAALPNPDTKSKHT